MKQKATGVLLALVITVLCAIPVLAAPEDIQSPYVVDSAGLLTKQQTQSLEQEAQRISEQYQCGVYIFTVVDFETVSEADDIYAFGKEIYLNHELGWGEEKDGTLLVLSMEERDFSHIAYGDFGNYAFTDYGKKKLDDEFLDDFRNNDWYTGFSDYLSTSAEYLACAREGKPIDVEDESWKMNLIFIGIGVFIALIVVGIFYLQMKTAQEKNSASGYLSDFKLTGQSDRYLRTTVSRRTIQSSGGKGGTTVDKDGFSGNSGKF